MVVGVGPEFEFLLPFASVFIGALPGTNKHDTGN